MAELQYRNRRAVALENREVRVTVLAEGGHIAELTHKATGVNPLWSPPWRLIEPSRFDPASKEWGEGGDARLLSGIAGHNLCMDVFGGVSEQEAAAGLTPHGEGSLVPYRLTVDGEELRSQARFPIARLEFERRIRLYGHVAAIEETVRNTAAQDHPTAWTQHVTLGPPFLERGRTQFRLPGTRSRVYEVDSAGEHGRYKVGANFDWPNAPLKTGGFLDLRVYPDAAVSGGFTTHLLDPHREQAHFMAWSPSSKVLCGYVWRRSDFPWIGIWEENHSRSHAPWNGRTLTRGMEFGVSPMPETRRKMLERGSLFGMPVYRWIPAGSAVTVRYCAFVRQADSIPDEVAWEGEGRLRFS